MAVKNKKKEITGVRIKLATPERIKEISCGEVTKPETINYRTLRPEPDGLFCEKIFGPTRSYECKCGKYKRSGPKFKGVVCENCGVEVTDNRVRRERMGHIELAVPVVHIWYLRGIPSRLSLLLGTSAKDLEKVVYFAPTRKNEVAYKIISSSRPDLAVPGSIVSESELKIHAHYDKEGLQYEDAYTIEGIENVPVNVGDLISPLQLARYKTDYGEDSFRAEPAFILVEPADEDSEYKAGMLFPASKVDDRIGEFVRAKTATGNNEAFIVTDAVKLPFSKGAVLSRTELTEYERRFTGRFKVMRHNKPVDDPCYLVITPGSSPFKQGDVIYERQEILCRGYDPKFEAGIGADGVQTLINKLDLDVLSTVLRDAITDATGQKKRKLVKRLQVCEDFRKSSSKPQSMILNVLPVIPPDLRPLVQLDGGRFATSDLNDLYRRVINRNNRLKKLQALNAPEIIIRNEKRMLQECVDALIDNGRVSKAVLGAGNRPLKSLTDLLRGKKGRFRQNLLGKRVDYSGRSVIVIGPELKIYQCGLPKQMALELFKPFVIRRLVENNLANNVKSAKREIEKGGDKIWEILENIIKDHPVMLNRAPTLHRLGIQAFEPVLMEGKAIRLHPMVCTAFNADFDGDQMAVHVPLSIEAQAEARLLMLSANNLLSPASGQPVVTPTQDIVLGVYYLTDMRPNLKGDGKFFANTDDVMSAISHDLVHVNACIWLREDMNSDKHPEGRRKFFVNDEPVIVDKFSDVPENTNLVFLETSPGRVLFNSRIHEKLRFVNKQLDKGAIRKLLDAAYDKIDRAGVVVMLDEIKSLGYHWAARSGISFGVQAVRIPDEKKEITAQTQAEDDLAKENYEMGLLTHDEYLDQKNKLWGQATEEISQKIKAHMSTDNPVRMMIDSGARGSLGQMGQMAGIRGLMSDPTGKTIDYPITANFREGMNMLEYFISTHGARKGLADTALRTAKSGYLTRRLVDVAQDLIITEHDCHTDKGICIRPLTVEGEDVVDIAARISGRTSLHDININGETVVKSGDIIDEATAKKIRDAGIKEVWVRSPLACALKKGVCQKCYGHDLSSRQLVPIGEAVGVVAAQSIGEPGTQLTMRTFHTGGVRQAEDITQGLPRIEQLFEVRRPRKVCTLAGIDGRIKEITIDGRAVDGHTVDLSAKGKKRVTIVPLENDPDDETGKIVHVISASQDLKDGIDVGLEVNKLTPLTEGDIDPQQLLEVSGIDAVQRMLVDEIQNVYKSQGVTINNKHIEVILRKVAPLNKLKVAEEGDSSFVAGDMIWIDEAEQVAQELDYWNRLGIKRINETFGGDVIVDIAKADEETENLIGTELNEDTIKKLLTPGGTVEAFTVKHGEQNVEIIIGKSAFYRAMEGLRLVREVKYDRTRIKKGTTLDSDALKRITSIPVPPIARVRDRALIEKITDADRWIAEDVMMGSRVVAAKDSLITKSLAEEISLSGARELDIWASGTEHIDINEAFKNYLTGRDIAGLGLYGIEGKKIIDDEIIDMFACGELQELDTSAGILNRHDMLIKFLSSKLKNKVLMHGEFNLPDPYPEPEPEPEISNDELNLQSDSENINEPENDDGSLQFDDVYGENNNVSLGEAVANIIEGESISDEAQTQESEQDDQTVKASIEDPDIVRFKPGLEFKSSMMEKLLEREPISLDIRAVNAKTEHCKIIRDVSFVQKMRKAPECKPFIHGITKAALATDSFLSAASFQQTAQVLAGAAVKAQLDPLSGLKENVIIGHLIPAGTGADQFKKIMYKDDYKNSKSRDNANKKPRETREKKIDIGARVAELFNEEINE